MYNIFSSAAGKDVTKSLIKAHCAKPSFLTAEADRPDHIQPVRIQLT